MIGITTSVRPDAELLARAACLVRRLSGQYIERQKWTLKQLVARHGALIVVYQQELVYMSETGVPFKFHPDTAILRIKSGQQDPLLSMITLPQAEIIDTTMGLGSDSIVLSSAGHHVTAIESNPIIHTIVSEGLQTFTSAHTTVTDAMRRIKTICDESVHYLKQLPTNAVDVVYADPMFSHAIDASENLAGLDSLANKQRLNATFIAEAKRVARHRFIIKAHYRDEVFEQFQFQRMVRPNTKFHYGYMDCSDR